MASGLFYGGGEVRLQQRQQGLGRGEILGCIGIEEGVDGAVGPVRMGAAMALLGYLLAVPFLLLSQWNGLFGKRVRSWAVAEEPVEHSQGTSE